MSSKRRKADAQEASPAWAANVLMQTLTDVGQSSEFSLHDADREFRRYEEGNSECLELKAYRNAVPKSGECKFFAKDGGDPASREADYVSCRPPSVESGAISHQGQAGQAFERQGKPGEGIWSGNGSFYKAVSGEPPASRKIRYFCRIALPGHEKGPQPSSPKPGKRLQEGTKFEFLEPPGERLSLVCCLSNNQTQLPTDKLREHGVEISEHRAKLNEHGEQFDDLYTRVGNLEIASTPERLQRLEAGWSCQDVLKFFPIRLQTGVTVKWSGAIEHFRLYVKGKGCNLWRELFMFGKIRIPSEKDPSAETGWSFLPREIHQADVSRHWGDARAASADLIKRDANIQSANWKRTIFCSVALMMLVTEGYLPGEPMGHPTIVELSSNAAGASSSTDNADVSMEKS